MSTASSDALKRARHVKVMIFDVDGVLTDGKLWYGSTGETLKAFNSLDGHGLKMLAAGGIRTAILSGRSSLAVEARAAELGIVHLVQGAADKRAAFDDMLARLGIPAQETGYMGDDVVDLPVLVRCGFASAPSDAHELVRRHCHFVSAAGGGGGAVREVCEVVLGAQGKLDRILAQYLA